MLERINTIPWSQYAQPERNEPGSVADALAKVERADGSAYRSLLDAVANDCGGTYHPVLLAVMPFLEEIVHRGEASSQRIVCGRGSF